MSDERAEQTAAADAAADQTEWAALVEAMCNRDETALARLYERTVGRVYSLAMAITGQPHDAEEVVCDVYWQVWRRADHYDPQRGSVLTWLLVNCRSLAIDLLRRRRRQRDMQDVSDLDLLDETRSAAELLEWMEEGSAVHRALTTLSVVQRQLILLAYFHDMSHQAIAEATQLPLGTVKSHIRRGLQKLRTALTP